MVSKKLPSAKRMIKIIALSVAMAYMMVFMFYWFTTNLDGFTYFIIGEANPFILITEWILGIFSISVLMVYYVRAIRGDARKLIYDPPI